MGTKYTNYEKKIVGSLLGLAWGDILGSPVEGWRAAEIRTIYGSYTTLPKEYPLRKIKEYKKGKLARLRPLGLHSDDTQQALALIHVCLSNSNWTSEAWANTLVLGMQKGAWRGYGRSFSSAIHQIQKGAKPQESGSRSAGIGAAMRVAPLGALYRDDPLSLGKIAMESSIITHSNICAGALSYAVAYTVAGLIRGQTLDEIKLTLPGAIKLVESEWIEKHKHGKWKIDCSKGHLFSTILRKILEKDIDSPELIRRKISKLAKPHLAKGFTKAHPNQGFVLLGGIHAILMAILPGDNPEGHLTEIIRQGYDTDTVGAICGGILGARFGVDWIPSKSFIARDHIEKYARALIERDPLLDNLEKFLEIEAKLTEQESLFQKRNASLI